MRGGGREKMEEGRKAILISCLTFPSPLGMLIMKDLGIDVELYVSLEVDSDAIKVSMHKLVSMSSQYQCATLP